MKSRLFIAGCTVGMVFAIQAARAQQPTSAPAWNGIYSEAQATRGGALYGTACLACHGRDLAGTDRAPAAGGPAFIAKWRTRPVIALFEYVHTRAFLDCT